jgi:hypothetical protein
VRRLCGERGQNLIEFAIVAPFVLLFIGAIVIFGLAMNARSSTQHAVREGARTAAVGGTLPQVREITAANAPERVDPDDVFWCHPDPPGPGAAGTVGAQVVVYLAATGGIFSIFGVGDVKVFLNPRATARLEKTVKDTAESPIVPCPEGIP